MLLAFGKRSLTDEKIKLRLWSYGPTDNDIGITDGCTYDIYTKGIFGRRCGYVSYRHGESEALYYLGHIGYHVDPLFRGESFAYRAVKLIQPIIVAYGMHSVTITTDVDNIPSRKTCEKLGCVLESIVPVPLKFREVCMGSMAKCRYILPIKLEDAAWK
ncbi:MAG: GNAT family N-acetyltransferase [Christensenellales bacterium]|jgi:predicted acetyltransferase|nr:GNAT family N-acetyltransferase [Clostridiales bacterium]